MNKVDLVGVLPRDPAVRVLESGAVVTEFTVGVREAFWSHQTRKDEIRMNWIGCVAWGDLAEYAGDHFHRGDEVYVVGTLTQEEYEKGDTKVSKTKVRLVRIDPIRRAARSEPGAEANPDF